MSLARARPHQGRHGDTDRTPYGWGTFASRSLVIAGGASVLAARKVRAKLKKIASHLLEAAADDIVLRTASRASPAPTATLPIETLARAAYHQVHLFKGEIDPAICETATYDPPGTFSNACHACIVEVDPETGRVTIERFVVAEDAGRLVNPMIVDGQIVGGVAQGIGNALLEEIIYDETRQYPHGDARRFSAADQPRDPADRALAPGNARGPTITQAKGLGEGGAIGAPAAVLNADQ